MTEFELWLAAAVGIYIAGLWVLGKVLSVSTMDQDQK